MGGGRDNSGAAIYKRVNGKYVRIAPYKDERLTENDIKWLRRASYDGNIAYVNPDNDNLVAVVSRGGEVQSVNKTELAKFRKSRDMKTGQIKKEYISDLASQYKGGTEDQRFEILQELTAFAKKANPRIGDAAEWRNGIGLVISQPVVREIEKTLGVEIL